YKAPVCSRVAPQADLIVIGHPDEGAVLIRSRLKQPHPCRAGAALAGAHTVGDVQLETWRCGADANVAIGLDDYLRAVAPCAKLEIVIRHCRNDAAVYICAHQYFVAASIASHIDIS